MTPVLQLARRARCALTVAMSAAVLSVTACGGQPADVARTETRGGALGSDAGVQSIYNLTDLMNMDAYGNYQLATDLNAYGFNWHYGYFYGTLDGGGHTISNLTTTDTIGEAAGLFVYAQGALIKNLKLTNLHVSGTWDVGGLVGDCVDCGIENVAVEGTMTANVYAGGIVGGMAGGYMTTSYFKGSVNGGTIGTGGLVGLTQPGDTYFATISNCYAQAAGQTLVAASTSSGTHPAGGIVGGGSGAWVHDVYAIGNVTGRGEVGGLIGQASCDYSGSWLLYNSIYRGNVVDTTRPAGWAGVVGYDVDVNCKMRFAALLYNKDQDTSQYYKAIDGAPIPATTQQLQSPVTVNGGVYCLPDIMTKRCGDNAFQSPPWDPGNSSQIHVLMNMPGPNVQLR